MIKKFAMVLTFATSFAATSLAETPEQREACMNDAYKFCGHAIPDRERVFNCLVQNSSVISPICRGAVAPHVAQPAAKPGAKKATKKTKTASAKKTKAKGKAKPAKKGPLKLTPG